MKWSNIVFSFITVSSVVVTTPVIAQDQDRNKVQDSMHHMDRSKSVDCHWERKTESSGEREHRKQMAMEGPCDGMGGMIYGSGMMTEEERNNYRQRIKMAKTEEERNEIREQHKKEMRERAKMKGLQAPEEEGGSN